MGMTFSLLAPSIGDCGGFLDEKVSSVPFWGLSGRSINDSFFYLLTFYGSRKKKTLDLQPSYDSA